MACECYDDAIIAKLQTWLPEENKSHVLSDNSIDEFFELHAEETGEKPFQLPLLVISRSNEISLESSIKTTRSFNGLNLGVTSVMNAPTAQEPAPATSVQLNVIPISLSYQLDIFTKTRQEGEEYVRSLLFKLINNPQLIIKIPYQGLALKHVAFIKVGDSATETSSIPQKLFQGQFSRWTIPFTITDAYLFNIPYRKNWYFADPSVYVKEDGALIQEKIN